MWERNCPTAIFCNNSFISISTTAPQPITSFHHLTPISLPQPPAPASSSLHYSLQSTSFNIQAQLPFITLFSNTSTAPIDQRKKSRLPHWTFSTTHPSSVPLFVSQRRAPWQPRWPACWLLTHGMPRTLLFLPLAGIWNVPSFLCILTKALPSMFNLSSASSGKPSLTYQPSFILLGHTGRYGWC